jgi:hypothetical protein
MALAILGSVGAAPANSTRKILQRWIAKRYPSIQIFVPKANGPPAPEIAVTGAARLPQCSNTKKDENIPGNNGNQLVSHNSHY